MSPAGPGRRAQEHSNAKEGIRGRRGGVGIVQRDRSFKEYRDDMWNNPTNRISLVSIGFNRTSDLPMFTIRFAVI